MANWVTGWWSRWSWNNWNSRNGRYWNILRRLATSAQNIGDTKRSQIFRTVHFFVGIHFLLSFGVGCVSWKYFRRLDDDWTARSSRLTTL